MARQNYYQRGFWYWWTRCMWRWKSTRSDDAFCRADGHTPWARL